MLGKVLEYSHWYQICRLLEHLGILLVGRRTTSNIVEKEDLMVYQLINTEKKWKLILRSWKVIKGKLMEKIWKRTWIRREMMMGKRLEILRIWRRKYWMIKRKRG
jgi:hypothetical protein